MKCPKCGSYWLRENEDGDTECSCGKIIYSKAIELPILSKHIETKEVPTEASKKQSGGHHPKPVGASIKPPEAKPAPLEDHKPGAIGTPSMKLNFALALLRDDSIKAFTQAYNKRVSRYGKDSIYDAYMEALVERNDLTNISKMLQHWIKYLETLPDCQHTRGAIMALHILDGLSLFIEGMRPNEVESEAKLGEKC